MLPIFNSLSTPRQLDANPHGNSTPAPSQLHASSTATPRTRRQLLEKPARSTTEAPQHLLLNASKANAKRTESERRGRKVRSELAPQGRGAPGLCPVLHSARTGCRRLPAPLAGTQRPPKGKRRQRDPPREKGSPGGLPAPPRARSSGWGRLPPVPGPLTRPGPLLGRLQAPAPPLSSPVAEISLLCLSRAHAENGNSTLREERWRFTPQGKMISLAEASAAFARSLASSLGLLSRGERKHFLEATVAHS